MKKREQQIKRKDYRHNQTVSTNVTRYLGDIKKDQNASKSINSSNNYCVYMLLHKKLLSLYIKFNDQH